MLDFLKKANKKMLYVLGILILLPILIIVFLAILQSCGPRTTTFKGYYEQMLSSGEKYFKGKEFKNIGERKTVSLQKLVEKEYIKSSEDLIGDSTCSGEVYATKTTEKDIVYSGKLKCDKYKEDNLTLYDSMFSDIKNKKSGLYEADEGYIFKGEDPNNNIMLYGEPYKILSIDNDGILKLLRVSNEYPTYWDNKYNVDVEKSYGKAIYEDSGIRKKLIDNVYNSTKKNFAELKKYIMPYKACIGKRSKTDYRISTAVDCSEVLENEYITIPNVSDYFLASLDPDCKDITSKSCRNYNYLKDILGTTWTMNTVEDTTYEAFDLSDGIIDYQELSKYDRYHVILHIDGNILFKSGDGSKTSPYVVE